MDVREENPNSNLPSIEGNSSSPKWNNYFIKICRISIAPTGMGRAETTSHG
jgi:hypothetical protein